MANTHTTLASLFLDIADAIRDQTGLTGKLVADQFPDTIRDLPKGAPNGRAWTEITNGPANPTALAYANGVWLCGTESGLYLSYNGKAWDKVDTIPSVRVNSIAEADGTVCGCTDGGIYRSENKSGWAQGIPAITVHTACYGNGIWVAGTSSGLYVSYLGSGWEQVLETGNFIKVIYCNGIWAAGSNLTGQGGLYSSSNGFNWEQTISSEIIINDIVSGNGMWFAGTRDHGIYYAPDGHSWGYSSLSVNTIIKLNYENGIFFASDETSNATWIFIGGGNWRQLRDTMYYDMVYQDGWWLLCGADASYASPDGENFNIANYEWGETFITAAKANGMWVGLSDSGTVYTCDDISMDNWAINEETVGTLFKFIANHNGLWILGDSEGGLYYSESA